MKKTTPIWIALASIQLLFVILISGCSDNKNEVATLTTASLSDIQVTTALSGGTVASDGGTPVSARGVCWSENTSPTIADNSTKDGVGKGDFLSSISGLTANTKYYVRAYATNSTGTAYGSELNFTTYGVIDIDENKYHSVIIGTQEWMSENLKTTKYSNGTPIPHITDDTEWAAAVSGAYTEYNNDAGKEATYGRLYNWFAVTDASQVCPMDWHVPTMDEWDLLASTLGGADVAGGKMKATGNLQNGDGLWYSPNTGATNESGFTALPGGERAETFVDINSYGHWWEFNGDSGFAYFRRLQDSHPRLERFGNFSWTGKSVRCVKD